MHRIILLIIITFCAAKASAQELVVTATIKPLQSITQFIVGNKLQVNLLVRKNDSPHAYSLKPSDVSLLHSSNLVFYINKKFETFLQNFGEDQPKTRFVNLSEIKNLKLLRGRKENLWTTREHDHSEDEHEHDHDHSHNHHDHNHEDEIDYHIWLSIDNVKLIASSIQENLSIVDKANDKFYKENLKKFIRRIDKLDNEIKSELAPYKQTKYIVFHDAYQYFEQKYNLASEGAVIVNPMVSPSAFRINELQQDIKSKNITCIFKEPQFTPKLVDTIVSNSNVKVGILDAEWGIFDEKAPLEEHYFLLMQGLANSLRDCLR